MRLPADSRGGFVFMLMFWLMVDATAGRKGLALHQALAELLQKLVTALPDGLAEFVVRNGFHSGQPRAGARDVRTQQLRIVGEDLAALAPARDADVKLFLADRRQRTRRGHDHYLIHRLALGGVRRDSV